MSEKLKINDCPACGSEIRKGSRKKDSKNVFFIFCNYCAVAGLDFETQEDAINWWNKLNYYTGAN